MIRTVALWLSTALAHLFLWCAFVVAAPFGLLAIFFHDRADDLEAGWRRGRKQNWLWRWARGEREQS